MPKRKANTQGAKKNAKQKTRHPPPPPPSTHFAKGGLKYKDTEVPEFLTFSAMGLKGALLKNINFDKPSLVQRRAMVQILAGKDVLAQAQPGTGKSVMAALCALQVADSSISQCQVLVIHAHVDLAIQFTKLVERFAESTGIQTLACSGVQDIADNINKLEAGGVHIISSTPEKLNDLLNRKALETKEIKLVIIDSADLLDKESMQQVLQVYEQILNTTRVAFLFTMLSTPLIDAIPKFTKEPLCILASRDEMIGNISQFYLEVEKEEWKLDCLTELLENLEKEQTIIFCNTTKKGRAIYHKTVKQFPIVTLDNKMLFAERNKVRTDFEQGKKPYLISTDNCGYAVDSSKVCAIINYDLPSDRENYIQRIGKARSSDKKGVVINFVKREDMRLKNDLEQFFGTVFAPLPDVYGYQTIFGRASDSIRIL